MAFWQVIQCDFINCDDPEYVTENIHICHGITIEAIRWAFTTGYAGNWHPLTWMSHMLDVQLFGLNPHWHHLTNLLFHIANTLLLFFVFHRMTKAPWKSAFVAALFALHPLHVESVAWVAERKDVLSTFFWMLTMAAYIHYVEHPRLKNYLAVLIFFALGLMAKPMLVTLPFVLAPSGLLASPATPGSGKRGAGSENDNTSLAAEPLFANKRKGKSSRKLTVQAMVEEEKPADDKYQWTLIRPLLWEKLPLFALAALSCIVTFAAQAKAGAVASLERIPPAVRIANCFSFLYHLHRQDGLARKSCRFLSLSGLEAILAGPGGGPSLCRRNLYGYPGGKEISVPGRGMAVVCRYTCASHGDCPGRQPGHGRPLHLYPAHRLVHHGGVGNSGTLERMALPQ